MTAFKTFYNLSKLKQEKIVRVAIEEFGEKGYSTASINSIVSKLQIAKGSIYQYFGDKKGLFLFILNKSLDMVKDYLRDVRNETIDEDLISRLRATLFAGINFIKENPFVYKLYIKILYDLKIPLRDEILLSLRKYSLEYILSLLNDAQRKGELREGPDLAKVSFLIDAVMDRFLLSVTIRHIDADLGIYNADENELEEWINQLTEFIRKGIII